jgi:O-antigen/teichoic acid export membrane protein
LKFLSVKDEFFKQTGLMFIGIGLFNLFGLLYHFSMLRLLSPVDYGHLNTLITLFMIISVPAGAVQTTITKFVASFHAANQLAEARSLLRHGFLLMLIIGLSVLLLISLGSPFLSSFLQISSQGSVILLGASLFFVIVIQVLWGGLQGLQKFGSLALNFIINGGSKCVLGIGFVLLGLGVSGALSAVVLSYLMTTLFSILILKKSLGKREGIAGPELKFGESIRVDYAKVYSFSLPVGLTLLCLMVLTSIDLIWVKHYFLPLEAGHYSIAQMIGKIIFVFPFPIVMVMFPKLASLKMKRQGEKAFSILRNSLILTAFLCGGTTLISVLLPSTVIQGLSGEVYPECIPLVGIFSLNMTFFSLSLILIHYQLSADQKGFLYPLIFFTLIQSGLIILFHKSLIQVLFVVGVVALCLMAINFYLVYRPYRGNS